MKKLLLLAAAALIGVTSAFAEATYVAGEGIKSPAEIEDGGTYFLHAYCTTRTRQGYIIGLTTPTGTNNSQFAKYDGSFMKTIPSEGTPNANYVWEFHKVDGGYKIKCVGPDKWLSLQGQGDTAKGNICCTPSINNANTGIYDLEVIPEGDFNVSSEDHTRFWLRLKNAVWPGTEEHVCLNSNGPANDNGGCENVAYWNYNTPAAQHGYLQIEVIPATLHAEEPIQITVHFPAINGWPVADKQISVYAGDDVTFNIKNEINNLGGMSKYTIVGHTTDLVASAENNEFTVVGTWDHELIPNHVYRVCLKPNDKPAAMRYDVLDGYINTTSDYNTTGLNTFQRLVPERLWFFKPVSGKTNVYTLHTMAEPEKGIYIKDATDNANYALATLSDDDHPATEFTIGQSGWNASVANDNVVGDFFLSYGENNANYLNERSKPGQSDNAGYLAQWHDSRAENGPGSAFRIYPILGDDLLTLGLDPETEPTEENIASAVADFNSTNVDAALRRIKYIGVDDADLFGPYVGQYNNEAGNAHDLYQHAVKISEGEPASDEEKQAIVDGLDPLNLTFKELMPNRYYRFKNKVSNLYISSISSFTNATGRSFMDLTNDGTRSNTVFFFAQEGEGDAATGTLVCFDNGLVLPSFNGEDWIPVLSTDPDAAKGTMLTYRDNGRYLIHVDGTTEGSHRHLYGAANTQGNAKIVDCAGNNTSEEYEWYIEEVLDLPLTLYNVVNDDPKTSNDGWTSVYSPVAIELPAESHLTAYIGEFDGADYSENSNINHVIATAIEPNADGKVIIPAGQIALIFFDGEADIEHDPDFNASLMESRDHITYAYVHLNYNVEATAENAGNLRGGILAFAPAEGMEYYTLHASHSNNFRELSEYKQNYAYIPGFKAYIENQPDGVDFYPIYLINPNTMVPDQGQEGVTVEPVEGTENYLVTITAASDEYTVHYKHTAGKQAPAKVTDHKGYTKADKAGNVHTITVPAGTLEFYAYHADTDTKSAVRTLTIGGQTGISTIVADKANAVCFDLQGRRILAPAKGINIINNQKVLVK